MSLYDRLADLPLVIEDYAFTRRDREVSSEFTRTTTVFALEGDGSVGRGEDVTYDTADHDALHALDGTAPLDLAGEYRLDGFSSLLATLELFPGHEPARATARPYRRWALESAALDLALRQAGTTFADRLEMPYDPVRFVISTRLGDPPRFDRVGRWLDRTPGAAFKLDPTAEWDDALIARLAATDAVRILDLKGLYEDTEVDLPPDPDLYARLIEAFPQAVLEDPAVTEETRPILEPHADRLSWDYPIDGVESVSSRPFEPRWLNIKPSRFGSVESLLATVEYGLDHDIRLYGGGQFELDVGREHLHALASCFYPDGPNDVAPRAYNDPSPAAGLPESPLSPPADPAGLSWSGAG